LSVPAGCRRRLGVSVDLNLVVLFLIIWLLVRSL
jgi:hypothetical protein